MTTTATTTTTPLDGNIQLALTNADGDYVLYKGTHSLTVSTGVAAVAPVSLSVSIDADVTWLNLHNVTAAMAAV